MLILEQVIMEEGFTKRFWMTGILRFLPIADSHQTNPLQIVVCLTQLRKAETCNKDPKYLRSLKMTTEPTQGPNQDPVLCYIRSTMPRHTPSRKQRTMRLHVPQDLVGPGHQRPGHGSGAFLAAVADWRLCHSQPFLFRGSGRSVRQAANKECGACHHDFIWVYFAAPTGWGNSFNWPLTDGHWRQRATMGPGPCQKGR